MSRQCRLCNHADRAQAELLLAEGASQHAVARKLELSHDAVRRHWTRHISDARKAQLALGPVQVAALAARCSEESGSLIDHLKVVRAGLYGLYSAAVEAGDRTGGALLAGRLHENLTATAKLTGEIAHSPLVQINNQQNVVTFATDPRFATFQADLIRTLSRFPEARSAVIAQFERLESPPPALEHEAHAA